MLVVSTAALDSGSAAHDATRAQLSSQIASRTLRRDSLVSQIKALLDATAFGGQLLDKRPAEALTTEAPDCCADIAACDVDVGARRRPAVGSARPGTVDHGPVVDLAMVHEHVAAASSSRHAPALSSPAC
jgi:hypothetical protein